MEIYFSSKKKRRRGRLIGSVRCGGYYFLFFFCVVCLKSNFEMGLVSFLGNDKKTKWMNIKVRMPPVRSIVQSVRQFAPPLALRLRRPTAPVCLHALWPSVPSSFQPKSSRRPQQLPTPNARQHLTEHWLWLFKKIKTPSTQQQQQQTLLYTTLRRRCITIIIIIILIILSLKITKKRTN